MSAWWLLGGAYVASAAISAMPAPTATSSAAYAYLFRMAHILAADLSHWLAGRDK